MASHSDLSEMFRSAQHDSDNNVAISVIYKETVYRCNYVLRITFYELFMVRWFLLLALAVYCTTFVLGLGITLRWWRTRRVHWLHHALFAGIWVSVGCATLVAFLLGAMHWYAPLAVLLWMAPLPLLRPGRIGHQLLAVGGMVTFIAVFLIVGYR